MGKTVALIGGVILLLLLYQFGARPTAPVIEADIQSRSAAAVADSGLSAVLVSTDGRDVTLTGTVGEASDIVRAGSVAGEVWGVRVVDNRVAVAEPYTFSICKEPAGLVVAGNAPNQQAIDRLAARFEELFHLHPAVSEVRVKGGAPPRFVDFIERMVAELAQLDSGCLAIQDREASLNGAVWNQAVAAKIRREVDALRDPGFTVSLQLDVPTLSEEAAACQAEYNRRLAPGETVLFDFDSAEMHDEGRLLLDEIFEIGERCPDVGVQVTGHTDSVGDRQYNINLSQLRAEVVTDYLVRKGVDPDRLAAIGYGYSQPVADNSTEEGRARNRRIEFRIREA